MKIGFGDDTVRLKLTPNMTFSDLLLRFQVNPKPYAFHPSPYLSPMPFTLHLTLNPMSFTLHLTLNPMSFTLHLTLKPTPFTLNPKP